MGPCTFHIGPHSDTGNSKKDNSWCESESQPTADYY